MNLRATHLIIVDVIELDVKELMLIMGGVLALLVVYMMSRKKTGPSTLRLKSEGGGKALTVDRGAKPAGRVGLAKELNVIFNYNGHDWDAYEVLGVPAGCSLEEVEEAYQEAAQKVSSASKVFLDTAYKAIRTRHRGE